MQTPFNLGKRLELCASLVRDKVRVADIGTDHAYLPVWLCLTGKAVSAVAADINPEPLSRGELTIKKYGGEKLVQTRLSDGLKAIKEDEADDIIIAGMGGELIAKILSECSFAENPQKRFILQPMTKCGELIRYLCEKGFRILAQDACKEDKKLYTVMQVCYSGEKLSPSPDFYYLGILTPETDETHREYAGLVLSRLEKQQRSQPSLKAVYDIIRKRCEGYDRNDR